MASFTITHLPKELQNGIAEISKAYRKKFKKNKNALRLEFHRELASANPTAKAFWNDDRIIIKYTDISSAFRALGKLMSLTEKELLKVDFTEQALFKMRGLMFDCSRNGVILPDVMKDIIRKVALMGINMIMLYTEDTYEVPGEPFFGYLRGAFTQKELRELDNYSAIFGIEMIPCIQTLAHLEQILKWDPYFDLRDTPHVLLADNEKTYQFIEKIISAATKPFRTNRIHIGMDEAFGIGTGRYKELYGEKNPFDIMNSHLKRVRDICKKFGKKPMIWSDMYFRLGSKTHDYYDLNWQITDEVIKNIPEDVEMVYWDYYHTDSDFYRKMIANHRKLGSTPIFAGGIWTWVHKWCALPYSFKVIEASITACKEEKIEEVFMTMWGDGGMEVDILSALPGIQYFAEHTFNQKPVLKEIDKHFNAITDANFSDFVKASQIDSVPGSPNKGITNANTSVGLLWQDPFFAILDPHFKPNEWEKHYEKLANYLFQKSKTDGLSSRLEYPALISKVLAMKVSLRRNIEQAYKHNNKRRLSRIALNNIPALIKALKQLHIYHRTMWLNTYKPFGWEVLEHRYGGLLARLETVKARLLDYVKGRTDKIEELEAKLLDPFACYKERVLLISFTQVKTPSSIK